MAREFGTVHNTGQRLYGSPNWTSNRTGQGQYYIDIDPAMTTTPSVVVSGIQQHGTSGNWSTDNVFMATDITPGHFRVISRDVAGSGSGELQDAPFSFIAFA